MAKIKVAIVDDSAFIRKALVRILESDIRFEVVGTATCGEELLDQLESWRPDVISLDLSMPGIGGLRTLDGVMELRPTPVIILSTHAREDAPLTIEALHRGAVDFIDKQRYSLVDFQALSRVFIDKVLHLFTGDPADAEPAPPPKMAPAPASTATPVPTPGGPAAEADYELVVLAASTGGPLAVQQLLEALGEGLPVPIVIVQHMPPEFTAAFAERLNNHLASSVRHATDGEALLAGTTYIAPGGRHLRVERANDRLVARLGLEPADTTHRPAADVTFVSAAELLGARAVGVVLTGMGRDGARGLAEMHRLGAHTIAQDQASSVVYGMPRAAFEAGAAREVLGLEAIAPRLLELF